MKPFAILTFGARIGAMLTCLSIAAPAMAETILPPAAEILRQGGLDESSWPLPSPTAFQHAAQAPIAALLAEPLTPENAASIALLRSNRIEALAAAHNVYGSGLAEALDGVKTRPAEALALDTLLAKTYAATDAREFVAPYAEALAVITETGAAARLAAIKASAADAIAEAKAKIAEAAGAAAETANEQYRAGTINRAEQAERILDHSATIADLAEAQADALQAREHINRLLGLWGEEIAWRPAALPALPQALDNPENPEALALRQPALMLARGHGSLRESAVALRSDVRLALAERQRAYDHARNLREVALPAHEVLLRERQLEYNGMLVGIYDLLNTLREKLAAEADYAQALAEFWAAELALGQILGTFPQNLTMQRAKS